MSLEMAQKVIVPQKKNYVPQFLKQRDINSYLILQEIYNLGQGAGMREGYLYLQKKEMAEAVTQGRLQKH